MTIGNIISELRKERDLSQKKLAELIGVSQAAIAKIEINRNEATASTIRKLSNYFQVSSDYLLGLEDEFGTPNGALMREGVRYSEEEKKLIEDYRDLNTASKKLVKQTIETLRAASAQSEQKKNKIS